MAEFLDYDPISGVTHWFSHDEATNLSAITYTQDVEPILEHTKALARDSATDEGIKEGWWLYAKIPPVVQVALRAKGIKLDDPSMTKRIIQEINEHYPALKCTQKHEGSRAAKQIYLPNAD